MEIIEGHLDESFKIIAEHINKNLEKKDETGKNRLILLAERMVDLHKNTKYLEVANQRLEDFEEKIKNLGFSNTDDLMKEYKSRLVDFLRVGVKDYLLKENKRK